MATLTYSIDSKTHKSDFSDWESEGGVEAVEAVLERVDAVEGDELHHGAELPDLGQKVDVMVRRILGPILWNRFACNLLIKT
jgi:hypothetical protein